MKLLSLGYGMDISIHNQLLASYPGRVGGERRPAVECLRMCNHSQKNLKIRLRLETVGKTNTCTFVWNSIRNKNKGPIQAHMHLIQGQNKNKLYVCTH